MSAPLLAALWLAAAAGSGEVKLPLADYLALVERAEAAERARAAARAEAEPPVAEAVSQRTSLSIEGLTASVTTLYEVELRGRPTRPVSLPVTGLPAHASIEPAGGAALHWSGGSLSFVAPVPGRYRVTLQSRAAVSDASGVATLELAPAVAPVALTELSLPADRAWSCPGAVVAEEWVREGRRTLRFTSPRHKPQRFELRRKVEGEEAERLLAQSVVVTLARLRPDGLERHDLVLFEVSRGGLTELALRLPPGLEPLAVHTDEGEAPALVEGGTLRVQRTARLAGTGWLAVTSRPAQATPSLPLPPVEPMVPVRARYLAVASALAASFEPLPKERWTQVDLGDLPVALADAPALALLAAWREQSAGPGLALAISAPPPAPLRAVVVRRRDTTTLLTSEGTLLHKDVFLVSADAPAFELRPRSGVRLWSALVDGVAVRPLERNGALVVPLAAGSSDGSSVEVVTVEERAVPTGRAELELAPPEVDAPVLEHSWRLLLPESSRFRYAGGALRPSRPSTLRRAQTAATDLDVEAGVSGGVEGGVPAGAMGERLSGQDQAEAFRSEVDTLRQGLVGGVRPVPVTIPEAGKVLTLTGTLPPPRVAAILEVRPGKR